MGTVTFDTLKFVERLKTAGLPGKYSGLFTAIINDKALFVYRLQNIRMR